MRSHLDDDWTYDGEVGKLMASGCSWENATSIAGNMMISRSYSRYDKIRAERAAERAQRSWLSRLLCWAP